VAALPDVSLVAVPRRILWGMEQSIDAIYAHSMITMLTA
jgi:hypothetical protein